MKRSPLISVDALAIKLDLDELRMISVAPVNPHHPHNHEYAKLIIPLVEDHHLLLVTLLLSNAAAMEALPIFHLASNLTL